MGKWIAGLLVGYHGWVLALAAAIACASWPLSRQLDLDWQVEGMFAEDEPLVGSYRRLQERFGGNNICLAVYRDPGLWDESGQGLERLEQVSARIAATEGVQAVLSLAELHRILGKLRGPMQILGLQAKVPPLLDPEDRLAQDFSAVFEGYTHRRQSSYVAVACLLSNAAGAKEGTSEHEATLERLRAILADLPAPATDGILTGEPVLVAEGFKMIQRDGWWLGIISTVLVSIVLMICFRSVRWTLIPLIVVQWSLLATQAMLVLLQLNLTMISSTLTAVVTVIGVATSMHLMLQFQQNRRKGLSRHEALEEALSVLMLPILWACITDAVGFSALLSAGVGPVRDFGLMMAIGSLMVFAAIVMLVPGLALLGKLDTDPRTPQLDLLVRLWLRKTLGYCLEHRRLGLVILALLFAFGLAGSTRMQVETDFTKNFKPNSPLVQGYQIIERELGGAGVWDIMLPAPPAIDAEYLRQVLELESKLRSISITTSAEALQLTKVLSIADADLASQSGPLLAALPVSARLQGMRASMPEFTGALLTDKPDAQGWRWLRIMLRSQEQATASAKTELVGAVQKTVADFTRGEPWLQLFQTQPPASEIAGYHVMLGKLVASILSDQWKCFLFASLGIYLVMVVATRSLVLGLAALLPNALPILLVLGTMGWLDQRVNMGVAMIAAVSLGLSVDSSIHYLLHYLRRIREGQHPAKALRSAQENVGLAVVLATVALIAGFISLCASEFVPTVVFGTLASLTMLGGLLGNLVMLPLLISRGVRERGRQEALTP